MSSLLYLSTLDNKSENSKKFHSLLLIKCGKLNYQTALSRFQRSAIGSCNALKVIKSNTQIRWKYFICIYLFFRLSEYREIEFIVKCWSPPSLVCVVIYSTSYTLSLFPLHDGSATKCLWMLILYPTFTSSLCGLFLASPFLFTPSRLYFFTLG